EAPVSCQHYSVDLVFQYLPDLFQLAHGAAQDDPLLEILKHWSAQWPLSSVGIADIADPQIAPLLCPELLPFYACRIIQRQDRSRLVHARVREEVRKQLGIHRQLAPDLRSALEGDYNEGKSALHRSAPEESL